MRILNRIYLALGVLFGIAGVVQCVRWSTCSGTITAVYLLSFIPGATFGLAYIAVRKLPRKVTHIVAIPSCIIALACWGFIALGLEIVTCAISEVTDIGKYEQILDDYWNFNKTLVAHFPRPIPPEAKDVKFSFHPGFLQGAAHIQLRYSLSTDAISGLYNSYSEKKTKSFIGGNTNDHMNMKEGMPPTLDFHTSGSDNHEFPDDFEIMIFDRPEGDFWNHGQSHGVAISKMRNEIVYWAESW